METYRTTTRRQEAGIDGASPLFIWEPVPDLCVPSELETCREALKHVQAVSPNHMELASFFGASANQGEDVDREIVEKCAADWLSSGIGQDGSGVVVVRCGKDGCYVASRKSVSRSFCELEICPVDFDETLVVVNCMNFTNLYIVPMASSLSPGRHWQSHRSYRWWKRLSRWISNRASSRKRRGRSCSMGFCSSELRNRASWYANIDSRIRRRAMERRAGARSC